MKIFCFFENFGGDDFFVLLHISLLNRGKKKVTRRENQFLFTQACNSQYQLFYCNGSEMNVLSKPNLAFEFLKSHFDCKIHMSLFTGLIVYSQQPALIFSVLSIFSTQSLCCWNQILHNFALSVSFIGFDQFIIVLSYCSANNFQLHMGREQLSIYSPATVRSNHCN